MKDLETQELILRKFTMKDADEIYESWIKGKMLEDIIGFEPIGGLKEVKAIINSNIKESDWGEPRWVIQEKESKKLVGYVATREISRKNKICRIIFNIADCANKESKYLEDSLQAICDYLLNEDNFDIVYTKIYNSNSTKSKKMMETLKKIGMKLETKFKHMIINEKTQKPEELCIFSVMRGDLKEISN